MKNRTRGKWIERPDLKDVPMELDEDSVELLCTAIIKRACIDYLSIYEQMKLAVNRGNLKEALDKQYQLDSMEKWFKSKWFHMICDLDGKVIIRKVREIVDDGKGFITKS